MAAYNQVNGAYCAENEPLLTGVLRDDWGFAGFVESDWAQAVHDAERSVLAGLDIEMPVTREFDLLGTLVESGRVPEATIDEAVRRILRRQLGYGLDARERPAEAVIGQADHVALAREAAAAGTVLLKNDGGLVPLGGVGTRVDTVAVVGALADAENTGDVGSSNVRAPYVVTALDGITAAYGAEHVVAVPTDTPDAGQLDAIAAADVAVVVVGLTAEDEGENIPGRPGGDREQLGLHPEHEALIDAVAAAHDRVVVVLVGGSAITVEGWFDDVEAVLQPWYGGMEGGNALADVLTGAVPPTGRLPLTVPTGPEQLPPFDPHATAVTYPYLHGYRHVDRAGLEPRFPFGFGLSTSTFELAGLDETSARTFWPLQQDEPPTFAVGVENTGTRRDAVVVQLYVGPDAPGLGLPDRVLAAFEKVWLDPGERRRVELPVGIEQLATWDEARHAWVVAAGTWKVEVGTSSRDLPLSTTLTIDTTPPAPIELY
jgi:beta-glucosidase